MKSIQKKRQVKEKRRAEQRGERYGIGSRAVSSASYLAHFLREELPERPVTLTQIASSKGVSRPALGNLARCSTQLCTNLLLQTTLCPRSLDQMSLATLLCQSFVYLECNSSCTIYLITLSFSWLNSIKDKFSDKYNFFVLKNKVN